MNQSDSISLTYSLSRLQSSESVTGKNSFGSEISLLHDISTHQDSKIEDLRICQFDEAFT